MKDAEITKIDDSTYRFTEYALKVPVYMYLLVGEEKALLIDTGYGFTDVPSAIKQITPLSLIVVNTHGHLDHTHGNHFYESVYLSDKDEEFFAKHNSKSGVKQVAKDLGIPYFLTKLPLIKNIVSSYPSKHIPLPNEMCFELGNRKVSIIETPGHTQGSISLFDEKNRWLFTGDIICKDGVLLHLPESTSVKTFRESIRKIKDLTDSGKVTTLFPAHQQTPVEPNVLEYYEKAATDIIEGNIPPKNKEKGNHAVNGTTIRFNKEKIV